ncbi:MAG: SDR family oxidoreductase [Myxococcota bacterium]
MPNLSNRVVLITGASRGIGAASARRLAHYGAAVVLTARTEVALAEVAQSIIELGGRALALRCDVSVFSDVATAVERTVEEFGSLDVLVNNAGTIDPLARLTEADPELWSRAVDINLKGVFYGMRAAIPIMERQGHGVVINMSSGAANSALEGWSHYCATKAAAKKLTECAHGEVGDRGIRVVGLSPGTIATAMMARIKESGINPVSQLDWSKHETPEWAAEAVAYLCTEASSDFAGSDFSIKTEAGRDRVRAMLDGDRI